MDSKHPVCFITMVDGDEDIRLARLMLASLRKFGGGLKDSPVYVFSPDLGRLGQVAAMPGVEVLPLEIPGPNRRYTLAEKVFACARAEQLLQNEAGSLAWINPDCLVVQPPLLLALGGQADAAFRPVHIRNIGLPAGSAPDAYWQGIYHAAGAGDAEYTVESFVDGQVLRPYFNTHCFAVNPALGLLHTWGELFTRLVLDGVFQAAACGDGLHRLFLHQAALSALALKHVRRERLLILPPEYSYPLHLQEKIPVEKRIGLLDRLVIAAFEEPQYLQAVEASPELRAWLRENLEGVE